MHAIASSEKLTVKNFFVFLFIAIPLFVSTFESQKFPFSHNYYIKLYNIFYQSQQRIHNYNTFSMPNFCGVSPQFS